MFGKHMVSPRGLSANLTNQLVCVVGIVTRASLVRPKLTKSVHYCEETRAAFEKTYSDQYTISTSSSNTNNNLGGNSVPVKDHNGNPLTFEYGLSSFKDHQILLVQEPPERTPVGQLPRSVEVILEEDLVDRVKPGDRIQCAGVFKIIATQGTTNAGVFRTVLLATNVDKYNDEKTAKFGGEDLAQMKALAKRRDCFEVLANSIAPSIYGHEYIKKALILQLLGGVEKNLENGTHLRGDINVLLIGDPSTAKSQFLRNIMSIAKSAINTTGRGSTGVGLTAAVVMDKDTGERHLEAGAMVLGDKGIVCIDEFDKMNDIDRVAIHEVMEQQTVTIAKAGIHCSLNARCSVLAAANPIYGEYQKDLPAHKNIGLPDSLLSRFDLVFIVLDEESTELDRLIADRVVRNHMFPGETPTLLNILDEKIVEPDLNTEDHDSATQVFEKYNPLLHGKNKKEVLTKQFLRKYLEYAKSGGKNRVDPTLTNEAVNYISEAWTRLRANDQENTNSFRAVPITVRTLETIIRLATAHAKLRLSEKVERNDCDVALELLNYALYHDEAKVSEAKDVEMEESVDDDVLKTNKKTPVRNGNGHAKSEKTRAKTKNTSDVKKSKMMIDDEEAEEEEVEQTEKKSSKKNGNKKAKGQEDLDKLFSSKPTKNVTEEQKRFVFKIVYDSVHNTQNKEISVDDLWTKIQKNRQHTKYTNTRSDMGDVLISLDKEDKILYSHETNAVVLV